MFHISSGTVNNIKDILQKYQFPELKLVGETILSESPLHLAVINVCTMFNYLFLLNPLIKI